MKRARHPVSVLLGKRLQKLRKKAGLSQEAFAHEVGIHRTYMGLIERGERNLTVLTYLRVVRKLGLEQDELLKGLPTPEPRDEGE
ncbi:helix-turn-helix domain-containing protein [bacterium]|nr:helix-turn-helix domain-containing protein [bacterium]